MGAGTEARISPVTQVRLRPAEGRGSIDKAPCTKKDRRGFLQPADRVGRLLTREVRFSQRELELRGGRNNTTAFTENRWATRPFQSGLINSGLGKNADRPGTTFVIEAQSDPFVTTLSGEFPTGGPAMGGGDGGGASYCPRSPVERATLRPARFLVERNPAGLTRIRGHHACRSTRAPSHLRPVTKRRVNRSDHYPASLPTSYFTRWSSRDRGGGPRSSDPGISKEGTVE